MGKAAFQRVTGRQQHAKEKLFDKTMNSWKTSKSKQLELNKMKILLWWISSRGHFYNPFPPKLSCSLFCVFV